jgi:DNA-binding NtrC family response regulator
MIQDLTFLIVDDDKSSSDGLSHLLRRLGASKISVAYSGEEAFTLLGKADRCFDCVIADIFMPKGNGLELLYHVRTTALARHFRPDMCVILMSGMASTEVAAVARHLDANAFLIKPFSINKLQLTITAARRRVFPLNRNRYAEVFQQAQLVA